MRSKVTKFIIRQAIRCSLYPDSPLSQYVHFSPLEVINTHLSDVLFTSAGRGGLLGHRNPLVGSPEMANDLLVRACVRHGTGSLGHRVNGLFGSSFTPGHRVIILTRCETRVFPVFEKMPKVQNVHLKC